MTEDSEGAFIAAGWTGILDDYDGSWTSEDGWVVKLDAQGNVLWQKAYDGQSIETLRSVRDARLREIELYSAALEAHRNLEAAVGRPLGSGGNS